MLLKYFNLLLLCAVFFLHQSSGRKIGSICSLPKETGPCRALFRRWYYNSSKGACERFIYGGCRGNANNFKTLAECRNTCS